MELFEEIFLHCPECLFLFDENGRVLQKNETASRKTGYEEEIYSVNIRVLFPLLFRLEENKLVLPEPDTSLCSSLYRKNHTCFPVQVRVHQTEAFGKKVYVCYAQDISKQQEAEKAEQRMKEQVQSETKVISEFVAGITHELRTPINGISGLVNNLLDTALTPTQVETVNIIRRCSDNMTRIINDLLDFSKLSSGKISLETREFSLTKMLKETLAFFSFRVGERGLKLLSHVGENVPEYVIGDELRLSQILNNLFSNAVKFTTVGSISFEAALTNREEKTDELTFVISDTGIGISDEEKEKLFKRFSQVDGSITRRFGGTGLGLSISKELIEMMNGSIHLFSEKEKGSTFTFTVKLGRSDREGQKKEFIPDTVLTEDKRENIITEDDLNSAMEKLVLSMELGSFEKAEGFMRFINDYIIKVQPDLEKKTFQLGMAVRREETEKIPELLNDLKKRMKEGKE